jgi:hypothetical protein
MMRSDSYTKHGILHRKLSLIGKYLLAPRGEGPNVFPVPSYFAWFEGVAIFGAQILNLELIKASRGPRGGSLHAICYINHCG